MEPELRNRTFPVHFKSPFSSGIPVRKIALNKMGYGCSLIHGSAVLVLVLPTLFTIHFKHRKKTALFYFCNYIKKPKELRLKTKS